MADGKLLDRELEDFYSYFLEAQKEGVEVYVGERIAMVIYPEEQRVGFSDAGNLGTGVFASVRDLENTREFRKVRQPRNLEGLKPELNGELESLLQVVSALVEDETSIAMEIYNEGNFNQRTGNYCHLVTRLYLDEFDGYYGDAVENYLEDVSRVRSRQLL